MAGAGALFRCTGAAAHGSGAGRLAQLTRPQPVEAAGPAVSRTSTGACGAGVGAAASGVDPEQPVRFRERGEEQEAAVNAGRPAPGEKGLRLTCLTRYRHAVRRIRYVE
jgi:hypothetical protein